MRRRVIVVLSAAAVGIALASGTWNASPARADEPRGATYLSNDRAGSAATYVLDFDLQAKARIGGFELRLPTAGDGVALGRVVLDGRTVDGAQLTVDAGDAATLHLVLRRAARLAVGARVRIELLNVTNPGAGSSVVGVTAQDKAGDAVETFFTPIPDTVPGPDVGDRNVRVGSGAMPAVTTGTVNTAVGASALSSVTDGFGNVAIGNGTLQKNVSGKFNVAVGRESLRECTGEFNTAVGTGAIQNVTDGSNHTAIGVGALEDQTTSRDDTAIGAFALRNTNGGGFNTGAGSGALATNVAGFFNTAVGANADVSAPDLGNATAIGSGAVVNASNKVRLGNAGVTVIEGQVAFTSSSDRTKKEGFRPVDGEDVLAKLRRVPVTSWNFIGHDASRFRHYGPMAQDFHAEFGDDGVGAVGTQTTINSGDLAGVLLSAVRALEARTAELKARDARIADLEERIARLERTAGVAGTAVPASGR